MKVHQRNTKDMLRPGCQHHGMDVQRHSPRALSPKLPANILSDPLIQLFYQNFHPPHPFLLPLEALRGPLQEGLPAHVVATMRYVGLHFLPEPVDEEGFKHAAYVALSDAVPSDGFRVQSLLLLALVFQAHGQEERARRTLRTAVELALDLGMHRASFAAFNSPRSGIVQEMWRRTYWELYVVDTILAPGSTLFHTVSDVPLPCEDDAYNEADERYIRPGYTLGDIQSNRYLARQLNSMSSFAYRVDAAHLLGAVLQLPEDTRNMNAFEVLDAGLKEWHSIAPQYSDVTDPHQVNGMLMQAHIIIYAAVVHLHWPRSKVMSAYGDFQRFQYRTPPAFDHLDSHTRKLLRAADCLSNLLTLPYPVKHHTPLLIDVLSRTSKVHLAACTVATSAQQEESVKSRIQLVVGVLNRMSEYWPSAGFAKQNVLRMYHEFMS